MRWTCLMLSAAIANGCTDESGECGGTECEAGEVCVVSECRPLCNTSNDCAAGSECIHGTCAPTCPSGAAGEPCSIRSRNDGRCVESTDGVVCRLLADADCVLDSDCLDGHCECADNDCSARVCHTGCSACQYVFGGNCTNTPVGNRGEDCSEAGWQCDASQACKVDDGSTCAADDDCVSRHCECVDATCSAKACSAAVCDCRFNSDGDNTCDGDINDSLDDASDTCGTGLTCNGSGGCHAAQGDSCVTEDDCESGFCADGFCCNNACEGDCDRCDESGFEGACRAVATDCSGDCAACAAHATGFSCAADQGLCPAAGATLCTSCTANAGELNCAFDASQDMDCAATETCVAPGSCLTADGELCSVPGDCTSGVCNSLGRCCDANGPCAIAIDTGEDLTCAVVDGGDVSCWGYNGQWQLGAVAPTYSSTPAAITGLSLPALELSVGGSAVCAVLTDNTVECWGHDGSGAFGDGNSVVHPPGDFVAPSGLSGVSEIAAGSAHMCALHGGVVSCWGNNFEGQVGNGTSGPSEHSPEAVVGITTATAIDAGRMQTCAVLTGGSARCWGSNFAGQLGDGSTSARSTPVEVQGLTTAVDISTGSRHSCAVLDDGTVSCWGANSSGQLGGTPGGYSAVPVPVAGISNVARVVAGWEHTCVLRTDGGVTCWGSNTLGTLGNGAVLDTGIASPLPPTAAAAIGRPGRHTCAALRDGNVSCWGANLFGDVGDGSVLHATTPSPVSGLGTVFHMDAGRAHTAAVLMDGTVRTWGSNVGGCLGDDTQFTRFAPVTALGVTNAQLVAAGGDFTCALMVDQSVACWGYNWLGQLGDSTTEERWVATPTALPPARQIDAGSQHACAWLVDNTVSCWGGNIYGQLGDGTLAMMKTTPEVVPGLNDVRDVTTGSNHSCVINGPNEVWCWGNNSYSQLGTAPVGSSSDPVMVMSFPNLGDLEASANATCVVDQMGQAWCWGANYLGQLGNGEQGDESPSAVAVSDLPSNIYGLVGFGDFMCALTLTDTVYCWGNNLLGQIATEPVGVETRASQVAGLTGVTMVAAGNDHACASTASATHCWGHSGGGQLGDGVETHALSPVTVTGW